jgi:hypothetical protein
MFKKYPMLFCLLFLFLGEARSEDPVQVPLIHPEDASTLPESIQQATLFNRKPFISSYWEETPSIRICRSSGVSRARVVHAVDFWKRLGYSFDYIFEDRSSVVCASGGIPGEIIILPVSSDVPMNSNIALTRTFYYTNSRAIIRSQIFIGSYDAQRLRVLEHEIGHALGWMHFNRSYHIMHHHYDRGGTSVHGLEHSNYVDLTEKMSGNSSD